MSDAEPRRDGRLPLLIVGGFLGAGKTTWLRHQLHEGRFGRVHLIVNEAAQTPVDNLLLERADSIDVIAGGCACCDGREHLLKSLREFCERQAAAVDLGSQTLVLETSGLADPGKIAGAIARDPILARRLFLHRTIVLVDALHACELLQSEALAWCQVEVADEIIITKAIDVPVLERSRVAATLRQISPSSQISFADFGVAADLSTDPLALPYPIIARSAQEGQIRPYRLNVSGAGGWVSLSAWLSAVLEARGDSIVRVKGVVRTPAGRLLLQSVRREVQPPEILPESKIGGGTVPDDDLIVLIGRNIDQQRLEASWRRFGLGC
ncbi:MAG: GTP-binding protein [Paracoccaceae bacterium]|nr:GTP-binding protein [Paracoccaceae bacterium]